MTRILSFWGAPGSGKSSAAFSCAGIMKSRGMSVELVPEFPKEIAWSGDSERIKDQFFIFAEQNRRLYNLLNKVDWIITDMPLPMTIPYLMLPDRSSNWNRPVGEIEAWKTDLRKLIIRTWDMYDTVDVFVKRDVAYDPNGRFENEIQSKNIENILFNDFNNIAKNPIITVTSKCVNDVISVVSLSDKA